ncbi:unnamed protein product [Rhizophagus irregularis]|uniref:Uncharacterized protein n=1 Tax=Rhizophagus irregularis TaxID=588596 RepID=A0A915ZSD8_9GLOM|nr:unnamed protein product [Rhizophagus irregularis]
MSQNQDHLYKDLSKISEKTKNNSYVHVSETKLIHNRQSKRKRNSYTDIVTSKLLKKPSLVTPVTPRTYPNFDHVVDILHNLYLLKS